MITQSIVMLISAVMLTNMIIGTVYADSHNRYCYDRDTEDTQVQFCFKSLEACEIEQRNDLTADSQCREQTK
ncbi:MAG TPA: hypothetical protein VJ772_02430 [Nitrososphaeraceae archaeon]|nr:hypothetical protein [Nitrososphaeraceae archaeon]